MMFTDLILYTLCSVDVVCIIINRLFYCIINKCRLAESSSFHSETNKRQILSKKKIKKIEGVKLLASNILIIMLNYMFYGSFGCFILSNKQSSGGFHTRKTKKAKRGGGSY